MEDETTPAAHVLAASMSQFDKNATKYATSTVHAKGASLSRIVDMLAPQPQWIGLDIATAAGHTGVCGGRTCLIGCCQRCHTRDARRRGETGERPRHRPGGVFGLGGNLAPEDPDAATWCDDFERRRDLSHLRCLPASKWATLIEDAGLTVTAFETTGKKMLFEPWADNMSVPIDVRHQLLGDLRDADATVTAWLRPELDVDEKSFVLTEDLFLATNGWQG